jgi:DNA-binding transcriptional regulator YiaG
MLEHMRTHPIKISEASTHFYISDEGQAFKLPNKIVKQLEKYAIHDTRLAQVAEKTIKKLLNSQPEEVFASINQKYTKPGAILKGIRLREELSQAQFAALIHVTQGDLSKMEHGKRSMGKHLAQRIAKKFDINIKLLLGI